MLKLMPLKLLNVINKMKIGRIFIMFVLFNFGVGFSQTNLDTIYIYFDSIHKSMEKSRGIININKKNGDIIRKLSISYHIEEIVRSNPEMHSTGYTFWHHERTPWEIKNFGGPKSPITLIKGLDFLNKIKLLDHHFFENTDYIKVCKTFEAEDSHEQDVIIFIIDKDEIKDGKIVLHEVLFERPVKI